MYVHTLYVRKCSKFSVLIWLFSGRKISENGSLVEFLEIHFAAYMHTL